MLLFLNLCIITSIFSCGSSGDPFEITGTHPVTSMSFVSECSGNIYLGASARIGGAEYDWIIKKYNTGGTEITDGWDKIIDGVTGEEYNDFLYDIAVDSDGNLFAVGEKGMDGADLAWYKKFSPDGTEDTDNWDKTPGFNGYGSCACAVKISTDDHVWIAGNFYKESGNRDWYIQEFQNDSTTTDCTTIYYNDDDTGVNNDDNLRNMHIDNNRVYAVGYSRIDNVYEYKAVIRVYSDDGTGLWDDSFGEGTSSKYQAVDVSTDSTGCVYVLGQADNIVTGSSKSDLWVKKYSSSGAEITDGWDKKIDYNYGEQYAMCLEVDSSDTVYVCYVTSGTSDSVWHVHTFSTDGSETDTGISQDTLNEGELTYCLGIYPDSTFSYLYGNLISESDYSWSVTRYLR